MITPHVIAILAGSAPMSTAQAAAQTKLAALVPAKQIYAKKLPQGSSLAANPNAITVRQRSGDHVRSLSGREGTASPILEVVAFADDALTAELIMQYVGQLLDCYGPATVSVTVAGSPVSTTIKGIFEQKDEDEDWLAAVNADEVGRHLAGAGFKVWHTEQS